MLTQLEETGAGFGLSIAGPSDSIVRGIDARFNLKQYRDEIVEETYCPEFSYATINLKLPMPCVDYISAGIELNREGFDQIWMSLGPMQEILPWLSLGTTVTLRKDKQDMSLSPSLSLESPACFDLYWGIDWDSASDTFNGLKLYGIGFHGEIGGVQIRSLTALLPDEIALVKAPYWELLGIVSKIPTCCGEAEASAVCYFGDSGLFDVGEVDVEFTIPIFASGHVSFSASMPAASAFTVGWQLEI
ncbi:MAG: hypothetical protein GWP10_11645 [Nitrospiraceae bacterium]|nr:hypothetical protein [Nitrospiraceae bacterium]